MSENETVKYEEVDDDRLEAVNGGYNKVTEDGITYYTFKKGDFYKVNGEYFVIRKDYIHVTGETIIEMQTEKAGLAHWQARHVAHWFDK